jgi:hypothetical protein
MFAPSQWHNLGQNPRVQREIAAITEGLSGVCEQEALNDLFDRFLKIGIPKAATKESTTRASRQGPLCHILHSILGQLRAGDRTCEDAYSGQKLSEAGHVVVERAKLDAVLCRRDEAEGTGIYDNLALAGLRTWEDTWPPERWREWLQASAGGQEVCAKDSERGAEAVGGGRGGASEGTGDSRGPERQVGSDYRPYLHPRQAKYGRRLCLGRSGRRRRQAARRFIGN